MRQFLALRVAAYLRFVFAHLRSCLIGALTCGLLALVGVTVYAFEPKHFVSLAGWLGLAVAVAITLWIFLQMDRNPTLSRIGGTTPGAGDVRPRLPHQARHLRRHPHPRPDRHPVSRRWGRCWAGWSASSCGSVGGG